MASALTYPDQSSSAPLDEHEMARIEAATVSTSLSSKSARLVRIERLIAGHRNPADQARARGFYDYMLARPSQATAKGVRLAVSYQQGWEKGEQRRVALNGRLWYETEKTRAGGKWTWRIYREGYFQLEGGARSETLADQQIEDSKADLMDRYGDWRVLSRQDPQAELADEEEEDRPRM